MSACAVRGIDRGRARAGGASPAAAGRPPVALPDEENQFSGGHRRLWRRDGGPGDALYENAEKLAELARLVEGDVTPLEPLPLLPVARRKGPGRPHKIRHPWDIQVVWLGLGGRATHPSQVRVAEKLGVQKLETLRDRLDDFGLRWDDLPWDLEAWTEAHGAELNDDELSAY